MALLYKSIMEDPDDDNNRVKVIGVQFVFSDVDYAIITYQTGRSGKQLGFRGDQICSLLVSGADWTAYNAARTKANQAGAEAWLVTKGIASTVAPLKL